MRRLAFALAFALSACATVAPVADKRAMAAEVFQLSGGLDDLKTLARFAPAMVDADDAKARCLQSAGRGSNPLSGLACDMVASVVEGLAKGEGGLSRALENQIGRMEGRAVDAMVETYSTEELAAMRRYYASPEGRSIVQKRSEYLARLAGGR